jgi:hypothetical protein
MQTYYQSNKLSGLGQSCDFSKLPVAERFEERCLCKALHFREGGHAGRTLF